MNIEYQHQGRDIRNNVIRLQRLAADHSAFARFWAHSLAHRPNGHRWTTYRYHADRAKLCTIIAIRELRTLLYGNE